MSEGARRLAGQVITTGIAGPRLDDDTRRALERLAPSGIILFKRNAVSVEQLRQLTEELHGLPSQPLVSIDHEGGDVMRLGHPFTQFPPAAWLGRSGIAELAYAVGQAMGSELASVGIDIDYAPVLDVNSNPRNPVIGDRAFGNDPETVISQATAFTSGLQSAGVLPCGKHFPGHGDTDRDSHTELPVVTHGRAELETTELPPFRAAIAGGIPMLMTAHVLYRVLDERHPATLSRLILHDLLRGELGFRGVVVSDDLEMQAISASLAVADAGLAALQAGVDWLMICGDVAQSQRVADRIVAAVAAGDLDERILVRAAERVRSLASAQCPGAPVVLPVAEHEALNTNIRRLNAIGQRRGEERSREC